MTLAQFKSNDANVKFMRELLEQPPFQEFLQVCEDSSPLKRREFGDANRILGRIEGYDELLGKIKKAGLYPVDTNIESDLEKEEEE
jgi:hypothetical protein